MRVCHVCGRAEKDPAWKLLFTEDKPEVPGWYWYRNNRKETEPVVVYVHPQLNTIGVGMEGPPQSLSLAEGTWAGPLEMPEK
jgi:hypothetical protein